MKKNINEAEWKVRVDLAAMFRLTHMMGWDDTVWNHITARTPGTDHTFFMHQFGLVYEEIKASNNFSRLTNFFLLASDLVVLKSSRSESYTLSSSIRSSISLIASAPIPA